VKRRTFIAGLGSAAVWPLSARAQQPERVRRIGALWFAGAEGVDPEYGRSFREGLQNLGWTDGRNVQIDSRLAGGDVDRLRALAIDLVNSSPEVIVAGTPLEVRALRQQTRTVPIVFAAAVDPVSQGLVESLAHPGGNITGCSSFEFSMGGKWVEILKEVAPSTKRVGVVFNPETAPYMEPILRSIEGAAVSLAVEVTPAPIRNHPEIEHVMAQFAREPGNGLIFPPDIFTSAGYKRIVAFAAQYRVPAVYSVPSFAQHGGLLAYGPDLLDNYRRMAIYVDRILKGAKPADLPVQAPTKFQLVVNLKAAKALGLTIAESFLLRADEVIE